MSTLQEQLISASRNGQLKMVKYLISAGADVTAQDNGAVRWASAYAQLETVKYLVENGADVTAKNNLAVRWAGVTGRLDMIEYLLKMGADINQLSSEHKLYFKQKCAYSKWRRVYLKGWIRKVLIPLYYSPHLRGGIQAKIALQAVVMCLRHPAPQDT